MGSRKNLPARFCRIGLMTISATALASALFDASSPAQERFLAAEPEQNTVVALGDSNTSGYGVNPQEAYPTKLQQNLRAHGQAVRVINAGWQGDTFGAMLKRIDFSVPESAKLVIVQGGYNDLKSGVPREVTIANLDAILSRLQARGIKTVVCGFFG